MLFSIFDITVGFTISDPIVSSHTTGTFLISSLDRSEELAVRLSQPVLAGRKVPF